MHTAAANEYHAKQEVAASEKEISELVVWGKQLLAEDRTFAAREEKLQRESAAKITAIQAQTRTNLAVVEAERTAHLQQLATTETNAMIRAELQAGGFDAARVQHVQGALQAALAQEKQLTPQDRWQIQALLQKYPPSLGASPETNDVLRAKTDPVLRSAEIIGNMK